MDRIVNDEALDILFRAARNHRYWSERPVSDTLLRAVWELVKLAPTDGNSLPARIAFVRSRAAKEQLLPAVPGNRREAVAAAPVTAIIGYDVRFFERLPRLLPRNPTARRRFVGRPAQARASAALNASLQAGYLLMAARALGLDGGLICDFGNAVVDAAFFPEGNPRSLLLCQLGYGDASRLGPRNPRLDFDEACKLL